MEKSELIRQRIQNLSMNGPLMVDVPSLTVRGIHGGGDYVTGICVGDTVLPRKPYDTFTGAPQETTDALMIRAARDLVPTLPKGSPTIGYFIYEGLPVDHCKPA